MNALITISVLGVLAMLSEIFNFRKLLPYLVYAGLAVALYFGYHSWNSDATYFNNMVRVDNYAIAFSGLILTLSILWFLATPGFFEKESSQSDHYAIVLFTIAGAMVLSMFSNLTMLFIGIEILSVSLYVLAASNKTDLFSNESGMKYFLMGSFATGILLFGMALIYGATGSLDLDIISEKVSSNSQQLPPIFYAGLLLLITGLSFKISAVPFHFWAPDVYQGAPTSVTSLMATVVKVAAFAAFYRVFYSSFMAVHPNWGSVLVLMSAFTMILGNLLAVAQNSFKRMMAYSGISHAGYMLMALPSASADVTGALFLYAASYAVAGMATFTFINLCSNGKSDFNVADLRGLSKNNPSLAFIMTIILLSMAGIPPLAGFFAKYYLFYGVIKQGYLWLVIVALISSIIGVYYYLRPVMLMYRDGNDFQPLKLSPGQTVFFLLCVIIITVLGFMPTILTDLI